MSCMREIIVLMQNIKATFSLSSCRALKPTQNIWFDLKTALRGALELRQTSWQKRHLKLKQVTESWTLYV